MDRRRLEYLRRRAERHVRLRRASGDSPLYAQVEGLLVDKCGLLPGERSDADLVQLLRDELGLAGDPLPRSEAGGLFAGAPLVLVRDARGWRHVLDGRPVPLGTVLELQGVREDAPSDEWVAGRYDAEFADEAQQVRAYLNVDVAGHTARIVIHSFLRLRWPTVGGLPLANTSA